LVSTLDPRLGVHVLELETTTLLSLLNTAVDGLTGDLRLLSNWRVFGLGGFVRHTRKSYDLPKYTLLRHIGFYTMPIIWAEFEK
jgi:hypothetical protein